MKTVYKTLLLLFITAIAVTSLKADDKIHIKLHQPPPNKLGVKDLWKLDITNTTRENINIYLTGTATESKKGLVVSGKSKLFSVSPGTKKYDYNDFTSGEVKWIVKSVQETLLRTGNVDEGDYTICVTAFYENNEVADQESCIEQSIRQQGDITLISPENGAELDPSQPVIFTWTPLPGAKEYTLKLYGPEKIDRDFDESLRKPLFEKTGITTTTFQYPISEKKLEAGKKYAWVVKSGNTVSNISYFMIIIGDPHCSAGSYSLSPVQGEGCCFDVVIRTTETWFSGFSIESSSGTSFTAYDNTNDNNTMSSTSTSVKWITPLPGYQKFPANIDVTLGQICFTGNIASQQPFVVKWSTSYGQDWKCDSKSMHNVNCGSNCCNNFFSTVENSEVNYSGTQASIAPVFVTSNPITKIKAEVISCYKLIEGTSCSGAEPVFPLVRDASLSGFTTALPYANEAVLTSTTGVILNNTNPINLILDFGPQTQKPCTDKVKFCVRYTFTDSECRSCDTVLCYGFVRGLSDNEIEDNNKKIFGDVSDDENNNNIKRGRASGIPFSTSFFENKILHSIISDCPEIQPKIISSFVLSPSNDTPSCSITKNSGSNYTSSCVLACENSYVTYSTANNTNSTYQWSVIGNVISTTDPTQGNSITVLWGAHSNGNVVTVAETNNNCTETATICVDVINSPVAQFTPSATSVCLGQPISFTNNSVNGLSYIWDFGDNTTSSEISPNHNYSTAGTYNVILRAINKCGCENADTVQIIVNEGRGPDINCPTTICAGKSKTYYTTVNCGSPSCYIWTIEGANTWTVSSDGKSVDVNWGNGPQGKITLEISSGCSCTPSITCTQPTTVTVPIISPNANIEGNSPVCINSIETYTAPLWPGTYYTWNVTAGVGQIISGLNTNQITVKWLSVGSGIVTLTYHNIIQNCGGSGTKSVSILPKFRIDVPQSDVCFGQTNNYNYFARNASNQPVNCNWIVEGGIINSGQNTNSINVSWTSLTGPYVVKATNNTFCNTEEIINVNVIQIAPPVSITGPVNVCSGLPYTYSAQLNNPDNEVFWQVNGGSIQGSANANPVTVIWSGNGTISVSEKSTSSPFCISTSIDTNVNVISISGISGTQVVCVDQIVTYTAGTENYAPAVNYNWSIDPPSLASLGSIIEEQGSNSIKVRWHGIPNNFTQQSVTINLSVCGSPLPLTHSVTINPPSNPQINPVSICPGNTAVLTTTAIYSSYIWQDASQNTISTNPTAVINSPGKYYVTVTDQTTGCQGKAMINVPVGTPPTASISTQGPRVYCPNVPVNTTLFALQGQGAGYSYQWRLNGNDIPGETGTSYTITSSTQFGSYTVRVTGANGCVSTSLPVVISESPCLPGSGGCIPQSYQADFTWANNPPNPPQCNQVTFTPSFSSNFSLGLWNYGDGNTGTGNPTSNVYSNAGFYDVQMNGSVPQQNGNDNCAVSVVKNITVPIAANFSYVNNCGQVTVTDLSTHINGVSITSTEWLLSSDNINFAPVTPPTPPILLPQSGTYYVKLKISNGSCFSEKTETIQNNTPSAISFTFSPNPACANTPIEFTAPAGMFRYSWDFGDGSASYERIPKHTYTTGGSYNVSLTVVDMNGCSIQVTQPIAVTDAPVNPVISGDVSICKNNTPHLLNAPINSQNHQWFNSNVAISGANNSSYGVTKSGSYYVTYTVNNCQIRTATVNVTVNPLPKAIITPSRDPNICFCTGDIPPQMQLTAYNGGNYSFAWRINGNNIGGNSAVINLTSSLQPNNSPYTVDLQVTDVNTGCQATTSLTINVYNCPAAPTITANNNNTPPCEGNNITLTANTNVSQPTFFWSNGETTQSITTSIPGTYYVTVYDQNGCSAKSQGYTIYKKPDASLFPVGCDTLCDTTKLPGPKGYSSYKWFRNGVEVGNQQELDMNPLQSGTYTLQIVSAYGCTTLAGPYNITAKDCSNKPRTCCENSVMNIQSGLSFRSGTIYEITSNLSYSPSWVKKISATIVGAQINGSSCTPNGEIPAFFSDALNVSGPISNLTGPVVNTYSQYSREVIWGSNSGTAYDMSLPSTIKMGINLPANTCPDVFTLNVKYSFFDENCQVCDTVVEYKIDRRVTEKCDCESNILQNGNFVNDFNNWTIISHFGNPYPGTNNFVTGMGCCDNGYQALWGTKAVGITLRQQSLNIQQGRRYRITFCARWMDNNNVNNTLVKFRFRASSNQHGWNDGVVIGTSQTITSSNWATYTIADWTATANFNTMLINAENNSTSTSGNNVSWGHIDNICITEIDARPPCNCDDNSWGSIPYSINGVPQTPINCNDPVKIINVPSPTTSISFNPDATTYSCSTASSPDCIRTFNWRINNIPQPSGPTLDLTGFSGAGEYNIEVTPVCGNNNCIPCIIIIKVSDEPPCNCDDNSWGSIPFSINGVPQTPAVCGQTTINVSGLSSSLSFNPSSTTFRCLPTSSTNCSPNFSWSITGPNGFNTQDSGPTWGFAGGFPQAGDYLLKVTPICGNVKCSPCIIKIRVVDKPNPFWGYLTQPGVLSGEDDPINISLNIAREKLAKTEIGKLIENWYESLNKTNWTEKILDDTSNISLVKQLIEIGRRVAVEKGRLNKDDIPVIENSLRRIEQLGVTAPENLIENVMKAIYSSENLTWDEIIDKISAVKENKK